MKLAYSQVMPVCLPFWVGSGSNHCTCSECDQRSGHEESWPCFHKASRWIVNMCALLEGAALHIATHLICPYICIHHVQQFVGHFCAPRASASRPGHLCFPPHSWTPSSALPLSHSRTPLPRCLPATPPRPLLAPGHPHSRPRGPRAPLQPPGT